MSRGRGVITDPAVRERVRAEIERRCRDGRLQRCVGWTDSPITGADGNREFLVHAVAPAEAAST